MENAVFRFDGFIPFDILLGFAARGGIFAFLRQKYQKKSPARIMYKIKNRLNCRRCFFDAGIAGASPESLKLNPILIKNIFRFLL